MKSSNHSFRRKKEGSYESLFEGLVSRGKIGNLFFKAARLLGDKPSPAPSEKERSEKQKALDEEIRKAVPPVDFLSPYEEKEEGGGKATALTAALAASAAATLSFSPKVLAQDAVGFINETHSQILSIGSVLYQVVVAIMGIIALISLITLAIRIQNSDREGASKATGWFAIMIFCIVMCVVIKNYMGF